MAPLTFAFEADRCIRAAFLGTSGHAFRNFLPCFPFAPVELVALWDPDEARGAAFARQFGAARAYTDLDALFAEAKPEAVFIGVEGFEGDEPLNVSLAERAFAAGCHVWMDKPLAARVTTAQRLVALRDRAGRLGAVGMKTMYNPAHAKMRAIVRDPAFGRPVSFTVRYPLHVPAHAGMSLSAPEVRSCLGHIWHPLGTIQMVLGPVRQMHCAPAPTGGGGAALATLADGTVGTMHFSAGQAGTSPLERFEVVGEGANVVVDNAAHLTYYRKGSPGPYGRTPSYVTDDAHAPLHWEPEMSLGQLYNTSNFVQGYALSLIAFAEAVRDGTPVPFGTFEDAIATLKVFEAFCASPGVPVTIA